MKNLLRPMPLMAAFLALASVVHASIRAGSARPPAQPAFAIAGDLRGPLRPGGSQPIDLALGNRTRSTLWITNLRVTVEVDAAHGAAGCSADRDFSVGQLPADSFPILLPPGRLFGPGWPAQIAWHMRSTRALSALGVSVRPSIAMVDLAQNQDACKGATLHLRFSGTARRSRPRMVPTP
jgi:hypothetical protein